MPSIPIEILQKIFLHSQEDTVKTGIEKYDKHEDLPWPGLNAVFPDVNDIHWPPPGTEPRHVLLQVCRRWRDTVLDTPCLWTTISLHSATKQPLDIVTSSFKRSRKLPLDVWLTFYFYNEDWQGKVLYILKSHLGRVCLLAAKLQDSAECSKVLCTLFPLDRHVDMGHIERFYCSIVARSPST